MFPDPETVWERHAAQFAKVLHNVYMTALPTPARGSDSAEGAVDDAPRAAAATEGSQEPAADTGPAVQPAPALSVAGAARGLGVAPGTLRSWERRYGLAPSLHTAGGHRRYGPVDLARLEVMHRLVQQGVPPAEAARAAIEAEIGADALEAANPYVVDHEPGAESSVAAGDASGARPDHGAEEGAGSASAGGGRVLPMPRRTRSARGLARAAMALDSAACQRALSSSLAERGAIDTWEELIRPVMVAVGERWEQTNRGVEIEHSFSTVVSGCLSAHSARLAMPRNRRPALLATVAEDLHDLPLLVLQAALSDVGIASHVLGARTPDEALRDAVVRLGPPVVFLWAQMPGPSRPELPPTRPPARVLRGGPGWGSDAPGDGDVADLEHAVRCVRSAMGL
jgi:DNA-binding transcriptional MerR regulator/methanogenic corrinoid protein MtbC1